MAKIYSLNPGISLRQVIPEGIYNSSENFVDFLKAYYEWLHTSTLTYIPLSGVFQKGEVLIGSTSKNVATISIVKSTTELVLFITGDTPFERDETIVGQTSGATGKIKSLVDNVLRQSQNLIDYRDVDKSVDKFTDYLKEELYHAVPASYDGDKRNLAKRIRDFYQAKGQEQAYKFFMKTLYGQDAEISYPGDDILRVSAGEFSKKTIIRARIIGGDASAEIFSFLFKTIRGRTSNSVANVVDVKKVYLGSQYLAEMTLSLVSGVFQAEESIYDIGDISLEPLETTIFGIVASYDIAYGGSGYVPGDILDINGDGQQATLRISDTYRSGIDSIDLVQTAYGYRVGATSNANNTDTGGSGLIVMVSEIANSHVITDIANSVSYTVGEIAKVIVVNTGENYYDIPTITMRDDAVYSLGMLTEENFSIVNAGNNYRPGDWLLVDYGNYTERANVEIISIQEPSDPPSNNYTLNSDQLNLWTFSSANSINDTTEVLDPFLTNNAEKLQETVGSGVVRHYIEKQITLPTAGEYYTYSVYVRVVPGIVTNRNAVIHLSNSAGANTGNIIGATANLINDTIASGYVGANSEVTNTTIQTLSNNWRRISISGKVDNSSNTVYTRIFLQDPESIHVEYSGAEYVGFGNGALYAIGTQVETGNVVTTYIPSGATVGVRSGGDYNVYLEDGSKLLGEDISYIKYNTTDIAYAQWDGFGPISRLKVLNRGKGYSLPYLSNIIVTPQSSTGLSANVQVTGVMGAGANVIVDIANNSSGIGSIKRIEPSNFGVDYSTANVDATSSGNGDALINAIIAGSGTTAGQYISDAGKIDYKKIQDSYYYQQYSYVIKSGIEISRYKNVLKSLLHASGLEVFGEISIVNVLDLRVASDSPAKLKDITKFIIQLITNPVDTLEVTKLPDFIGGGDTVFAEIPISAVEHITINTYKYYSFSSPFGISVYFEVEKNRKIPGTVSVDATTKVVSGSGTEFTEYFYPGDEFVVLDRSGATSNNRFTVATVTNNTSMTIKKSPSTDITGAEAYVLSI